MVSFLNGPFLIWLSPVVLGATCIAAILFHFGRLPRVERYFGGRRHCYRFFARGVIAFRILYAALLTLIQYTVWHANTISRTLLDSPLIFPNQIEVVPRWIAWVFNGQGGYFFFYVWGRFWFNAALSIGVAFLWYLFLRFLARRRDRFFDEGEVMLGFLSALLVGWPHITLFIPLLFFCVVGVSLVRRLVWGHQYTTLGTPFILSALLIIPFGAPLLALTGLSVLSI